MSRALLAKICIVAEQSVSSALACIEASGGEIALVVDSEGHLVGTVTDGDVRRGILSGASLDAPVSRVMNSSPKYVVGRVDLADLAKTMAANSIAQMPVLDDNGVVIDIILAKDIKYPTPGAHPVVIMAGGLGTRLRPITETVPKPMIPIGGRPILELIIARFRDQGFENITLCVNHLAEVIKEYFDDGRKFGVRIDYVQEKKRLGTAGALSLISPAPALPTIVMNGDILTEVNFSHLLNFHYENRAWATMGLNRFQYGLPYGVVDVEGSQIKSFKEKPVFDFFVNAGIYVVGPEAFALIPPDTFFDMPTLFEQLSEKQRVAFPIHEYWLDIGRHGDLERAIQENLQREPE